MATITVIKKTISQPGLTQLHSSCWAMEVACMSWLSLCSAAALFDSDAGFAVTQSASMSYLQQIRATAYQPVYACMIHCVYNLKLCGACVVQILGHQTWRSEYPPLFRSEVPKISSSCASSSPLPYLRYSICMAPSKETLPDPSLSFITNWTTLNNRLGS